MVNVTGRPKMEGLDEESTVDALVPLLTVWTMAGEGHCQLERKYAHRLKVADCHSVIFGPQNGPPDSSHTRGHFPQTPRFCLNLTMPLPGLGIDSAQQIIA
jgi:hypothetical protein